tara:strand:- start:286 stop:660 length:375 start_codon:yes stop_codon:yes gene_type:complete
LSNITQRKPQLNQKIYLTKPFEVFSVEKYTIINEIIKKIKSKLFHQIGDAEYLALEYVKAIKTKGVAIQCNIQSVHAKTPKASLLIFKFLINFKLHYINYCKDKKVNLLLQLSCNSLISCNGSI